MRLNNYIKFQKTLALAASASNQFEAEAAEFAARRLMAQHNIDPTDIPDRSLYSRSINFADNVLLQKLRTEYRVQHPIPAAAVKPSQIPLDYLDSPAIPFSMGGFTKFAHTKKKKSKKESAAQLTPADYESIRLLLNEGHRLKEIANRTGFKASTVNSTRTYHIRKGKWIRDGDGRLQWAIAAADEAEPYQQKEVING